MAGLVSLVRLVDTGIGDKILDMLGVAVLKQALGLQKATIVFCNGHNHWWGSYDPDLFSFPTVDIVSSLTMDETKIKKTLTASSDNDIDIVSSKIIAGSAGCSLHPYKIHKFLKKHMDMSIDVDVCCHMFLSQAKLIQPSHHLNKSIPDDVKNCVGIHLRKGDKIDDANTRHGTSSSELADIMSRLESYLIKEIAEGENTYFVCSDDEEWKTRFTTWLQARGGRIVIMEDISATDDDYSANNQAVQDFFMLSRCKKILQGIGYSTFSMAASIIGQPVPVVNFSQRGQNDPWYFLHWWKAVIHFEFLEKASNESCLSLFEKSIKDISWLDMPLHTIDIQNFMMSSQEEWLQCQDKP